MMNASAAKASAGAKNFLLPVFIDQLLMPRACFLPPSRFDALGGMMVGIVEQLVACSYYKRKLALYWPLPGFITGAA